MNALPAFGINLWLAGIPILCITAAVVMLLRTAPARLRYVVALLGFVLVVVVPFFLTREAAPVIVTASAGSADGESFGVAVAAIVLWFAGTVILVARELHAYLRLFLEKRIWQPAGAIAAVRSRFTVFVSRDGAPRTHGLLRPVIVLPESLARSGGEIVRLVVAHEESHARWRDPMFHAVIRLVRSLFWIALPLWLAERIVIREREAAADEAALTAETGETRSRYAKALVEFCRLSPQRSALAVQIGAAADLEYRVRRILRASSGAGSFASALALLCAGFFLFAFTPLAELPAEVVVEVQGVRVAHELTGVVTATEVQTAIRAEVERKVVVPAPVTKARAVAASRIEAATAEAVAVEPVEGPSPLTPLPPGEGKGVGVVAVEPQAPSNPETPVPVVTPDVDDEVIVIRNVHRHRHVAKGDGDRRNDEATMDTGRSKHPVALFHRAVTAPVKRLVRRARGTG